MPLVGRIRLHRGLAFKLALFILTGATLVMVAAFAYYHFSAKAMLLKSVKENAKNLTRASVYRIDAMLNRVESVPEFMAMALGGRRMDKSAIMGLLRDFLESNDDVFGACVAFEQGVIGPRDVPFAPYFYKTDKGLAFTGFGDSYDFTVKDWYLIPKEIGRPLWSEPYFDEGGGNIVMATYSVPIFRQTPEGRQFLGVATADISLDWLKQFISKIFIYNSGYAFLISQNGVFVSHPDKRLIMRESIFSLAEQHDSPELRAIGKDMVKGERGFARLPDFILGKPAWLSYAPVNSSSWSLGIIVPEDELFSDLHRLSAEVVAIGIIGVCVLFGIILLISTRITKPLMTLAATTGEIARGNLDIIVPESTSNDEVGALSRSFEEMRLALKEYIANLTETTKAKERLESELKIARTIQMSFLPKRFPPFPEITAFELHAALEPAWEVGGDLYDFFLLGERHLFFSVGDVSGKGVPAALFMAVAKTLVKGIAEQDTDPAVILGKVNQELCVDNESMLFVTMFCGILDFETGQIVYSNAGHNPPALLRKGSAPEWLPVPKGFFLGIMNDAVYRTGEITLSAGDKLVVFTDGVTEAMNEADELYGNERLMALLSSGRDKDPEDLDRTVMASVHAFAGKAPQADDITVLTLRFKGRMPPK